MRLTQKLCAIVLSLVLLISCMSVFTVSAVSYTEISLTGVISKPGNNAFYLRTSTTDLPGDWTKSFIDLTVTVNGETIDRNHFGFKYTDTNVYQVYFEFLTEVLPATPAFGTTITISGQSACYTGNQSTTVDESVNGIRLKELFTMTYTGTEGVDGWYTYSGDITNHDMTIKGINSFSNGSGYLAVETTAATSWDYPYPELTVTVDGTKLTGTDDFDFKYTGPNTAYVSIPSVASPVEGTTVTISGFSKAYQADRKLGPNFTWGSIALTNVFEMVYNGSAWEVQIDYTDYSGKLTMAGAMTNSKSPSDLYLKGGDSLNAYQIPVEGSWEYKAPAASGDTNGIFLNGSRVGGQILKYNNANNYWYAEGFTAANAGDILTIQGAFINDATGTRITIEKSMFIWDGTTWADYIDYTTYTGTLTTVGATNITNAAQLYLKGSDSLADAYADTNWADRLVPMDGDDNGVFVNDSKVQVDGNYGKILKFSANNEWYTDISGATTGTIVTIQGTFYNADRATKVTIEECSFQWNGSNWVDYDTTDYLDISLATIDANSALNGSTWFMYFYVSGTMPGSDWEVISGTAVSYQQIVVADGEEHTVTVKNGGSGYMFMELPASLVSTGTTVVIKSGKYKSNVGGYGYNLTADFTIQYDGSTWNVPVEYHDITGTAVGSNTALKDTTWFVYVNLSAALSTPAWDDGGVYSQTITINGNPTTVVAKNASDVSSLFLEIPAASLTPGDTVVVKAGQYESTNGYGYNLTADFAMTYASNGFFAGTITQSVVADPVGFNAASSYNDGWALYLIPQNLILGPDWNAWYTQNVTVDGLATTIRIQHGGSGGLMYITIPSATLPLSGEHTIVFKAGYYADDSGTYAYTISKDIAIYVDKYGMSFDGFIAPNTTATLTLELDTANKGGATGLYAISNADDGGAYDGDNWSIAPTAYKNGVTADGKTFRCGEESGFFLNGMQCMNAEGKTGIMKKLGETSYYIALGDVDASASAGTILLVKGLFRDNNDHLVEIAPSYFRFDGTEWLPYLGDFSGATAKYDVNGDTSIDVRDAVMLECWLADNGIAALSNASSDLDGSGTIDAEDQRLLRRYILGIYYEYVDEVPVGVPYYGTAEMVKCAYDAPKLGTIDSENQTVTFLSDDEIDRLMDEYAAVGFTHIQTEFVASYYYSEFGPEYYSNALLYRYYEEAAERGLKVIVYSNDICSWLASGQETDIDEYAPNWKAVLDLVVTENKKYSAFWGFYMSDEPVTAGRVANYQKITAYIRETYPEVGMWWCNNPITAAEGYITPNTGLTYEEYVAALGSSAGQFMYDAYVLREYDPFFGRKVYYIEPVWFSNLYTVATAAKEGGFTTGITLQSVSLDPSENWIGTTWQTREILSQRDIGWQVYTALAYGMKSLNFFTYWEHWDTGADTIEDTAMIGPDGVANAHYQYVLDTYANVQTLEGVLLNYDWQGTIELDLPSYDGNDDSWSTYTDANNARLVDGSVTNSGAAVIGCLEDKDGFDAFMIANAQEPHEGGSTTVSMTFNQADQALVYGADGSVTTVDLTNGQYSVTLAAGTGVLVIPVYNG